MQSIALNVTHDDGNIASVTCTASDFIAFETHFDKSISALESGRLTYLYWLAWHGLKRTNRCDVSFDDWVAAVTSIEVSDNGSDEISPLESPQPTG
jgi:hypothetical protein